MSVLATTAVADVDRSEFRRGFIAILPLWLGVVPFAIAFALLARTSGFSGLETMALSAFVFAGSAQLAFVSLLGDGAGATTVIGTVLMLNLRHVLYGLALNDRFSGRTRPSRPVLAYFLTDESFGVTIRDVRQGRGSPGFLFGCSVSLFVCYVVGTAVGVMGGSLIPDPGRLRLDVVFPYSFLALLLPLLHKRLDYAVATIAATSAIALSAIASGGVTILVATIGGASIGTAMTMRFRSAS